MQITLAALAVPFKVPVQSKEPHYKRKSSFSVVKLEKCLWSIDVLHLKLIYAAWLSVLSLCQIGAASCCLQSVSAFTHTVFQRRSLFSKAALVPSSAEGSVILVMRGWSLLRGLTTQELKLICPGFSKLIKRENPTPEHLSPKRSATHLTSVSPWYLKCQT